MIVVRVSKLSGESYSGRQGLLRAPGGDAAQILRSTSDPKIAAALLEMAAELSSEIDEAAPPDSGPRAPDVERPA